MVQSRPYGLNQSTCMIRGRCGGLGKAGARGAPPQPPPLSAHTLDAPRRQRSMPPEEASSLLARCSNCCGACALARLQTISPSTASWQAAASLRYSSKLIDAARPFAQPFQAAKSLCRLALHLLHMYSTPRHGSRAIRAAAAPGGATAHFQIQEVHGKRPSSCTNLFLRSPRIRRRRI